MASRPHTNKHIDPQHDDTPIGMSSDALNYNTFHLQIPTLFLSLFLFITLLFPTSPVTFRWGLYPTNPHTNTAPISHHQSSCPPISATITLRIPLLQPIDSTVPPWWSMNHDPWCCHEHVQCHVVRGHNYGVVLNPASFIIVGLIIHPFNRK